ncbi:MAG: chorismate mutase [Planctomycetes bacterium]|nr:chorismate mutase [Planctomycetota bacterium]
MKARTHGVRAFVLPSFVHRDRGFMSEEDPIREPTSALESARHRIDQLDRRFLELLAERMQAVQEIGHLKQRDPGGRILDPTREQALLERWMMDAEAHGLSGWFAGRILREILDYSRRRQERHVRQPGVASARGGPMCVGYQGVRRSYSELALTKLFATRAEGDVRAQGFDGFSDVVRALRAGELDYALLPVENTITGSIGEVNQLLCEPGICVVDEEIWPVEHRLVGLEGATLDGLRKVRSHPVALQQCRRFLHELTVCELEVWVDTAAAAASLKVEGDVTIGALCSADAAREHELRILADHVADHEHNLTRFLLIAREPEPVDPRQLSKTSLVLTLRHEHGALARCLQAFANHRVNLTRLESRAQPETPWQYRFFLDLEGRIGDADVDAALDEVAKHANHLRILGSYPRRS